MSDSKYRGAVYTVPGNDLPPVAVVLNPQGEVVTAVAVPSVEAGEALLADAMKSAADEEGLPFGRE